MNLTEPLERRQFNDGLDLAFKQDRQDDDVQRGRSAQTGIDLDIVRRDVREQYTFFLERALPHQSFTSTEPARNVLALAIGITGKQLQVGFCSITTFVEVEHAMLHRD